MINPVKYIWTARIKKRGVINQASVAKTKVLKVAQTGLNQSSVQPVRVFKVATLKERIKKVAQTRTTMPAKGVE